MATRDLPPSRPVRLGLVGDHELVRSGLRTMLAPHADRVRLVELADDDAVLLARAEVDVVLCEPVVAPGSGRPGLVDLLAGAARRPGGEGAGPRLVAYSWSVDPALVEATLRRGAAAYLGKDLGAADLVRAVEDVHRGRRVSPTVPAPPRGSGADRAVPGWPGRDQGLSARESETIALITQGLSNQEIADRSFLSINSVKTYIRSAYRKIGVTRRSQAVLWGLQHGVVAVADLAVGRGTDAGRTGVHDAAPDDEVGTG